MVVPHECCLVMKVFELAALRALAHICRFPAHGHGSPVAEPLVYQTTHVVIVGRLLLVEDLELGVGPLLGRSCYSDLKEPFSFRMCMILEERVGTEYQQYPEHSSHHHNTKKSICSGL